MMQFIINKKRWLQDKLFAYRKERLYQKERTFHINDYMEHELSILKIVPRTPQYFAEAKHGLLKAIDVYVDAFGNEIKSMNSRAQLFYLYKYVKTRELVLPLSRLTIKEQQPLPEEMILFNKAIFEYKIAFDEDLRDPFGINYTEVIHTLICDSNPKCEALMFDLLCKLDNNNNCSFFWYYLLRRS